MTKLLHDHDLASMWPGIKPGPAHTYTAPSATVNGAFGPQAGDGSFEHPAPKPPLQELDQAPAPHSALLESPEWAKRRTWKSPAGSWRRMRLATPKASSPASPTT